MPDTPSSTVTPAHIKVDQPDPIVRRIAIDVPARRNAMNPAVVSELKDAFVAALEDPGVRAIVLTGTGGCFCCGGDLKSMDEMTEQAARERMQRNHAFAAMVRNAAKPVVSAVEGIAMGGGAGLALLPDLVVAGKGAKIGFPFLRVGLVPDYGLLHTLPRRVGWARARRMILNCEVVAGEQALSLGLVDELVDDADVQSAALVAAVRLARLPQRALRRVKEGFDAFPGRFEDDMAWELRSQVASFIGEELKEGVAAFVEKREPEFDRVAR
jgi:enoyl-CoA hydratase/carnithine racemase